MASAQVRGQNTDKAIEEIEDIAATEQDAAVAAQQAEKLAAPLGGSQLAARRNAWQAATSNWSSAAYAAAQITQWYNYVAQHPADYYAPLVAAWDPMFVATGKNAAARRESYLAKMTAAQKQAAWKPGLNFPPPAPPVYVPAAPVGGVNNGVGPSNPGTPAPTPGPGTVTPPGSGGSGPGNQPAPSGTGTPPLGEPPLGGVEPEPPPSAGPMGLPLWAWGVGILAVGAAVLASQGRIRL